MEHAGRLIASKKGEEWRSATQMLLSIVLFWNHGAGKVAAMSLEKNNLIPQKSLGLLFAAERD
jgi:hypothetical protein